MIEKNLSEMGITLKRTDTLNQKAKNLELIFKRVKKEPKNSKLIEEVILALRDYIGSAEYDKILFISEHAYEELQLEKRFRNFQREICFDPTFVFDRNRTIWRMENILGFSLDDCKRALKFIRANSKSKGDALRLNTRILYYLLWLETRIIKRRWSKELMSFYAETHDDEGVVYNREKVFFFYYIINGGIPEFVKSFPSIERYLIYMRASVFNTTKELSRHYFRIVKKRINEFDDVLRKGKKFGLMYYALFVEEMMDKFRKDVLEGFSRGHGHIIKNRITNTRLIKKGGRVFYTMPQDLYGRNPLPTRWEEREALWKKREIWGIEGKIFNYLNEIYQQKIIPLYEKEIPHAYIKGRSYLSCAKLHQGSRFIVKTDISSFFESITKQRIAESLQKYGKREDEKEEEEKILTPQFVSEYCVYDDKLRLGSRCSPVISNLVAFNLDKKIMGLINKKFNEWGLIYTRYSDDLFFSSKSKKHFPFKDFINELKGVAQEEGFKLNLGKTRFLTDKYRKSMLSVVLNEGIFSCSKHYRRELRVRIFRLIGKEFRKFVSDGYLDKRDAEEEIELEKERIKGQIAYIKGVNREQGEELERYIKDTLERIVLSKKGIEDKDEEWRREHFIFPELESLRKEIPQELVKLYHLFRSWGVPHQFTEVQFKVFTEHLKIITSDHLETLKTLEVIGYLELIPLKTFISQMEKPFDESASAYKRFLKGSYDRLTQKGFAELQSQKLLKSLMRKELVGDISKRESETTLKLSQDLLEFLREKKIIGAIEEKDWNDKDVLKKNLSKLTVKDLKQACKKLDISGYSKLRKKEIIDLILSSI